MTPCFFHIFINAKDDVNYESIKKEMDKALDWFKYDSKNWIVYTSSNANKWYERLKKLVEPDGDLFICKLDISDRNGWMEKEFWEWIKKERH
jgi:hypothetical protein